MGDKLILFNQLGGYGKTSKDEDDFIIFKKKYFHSNLIILRKLGNEIGNSIETVFIFKYKNNYYKIVDDKFENCKDNFLFKPIEESKLKDLFKILKKKQITSVSDNYISILNKFNSLFNSYK